MQPSEGASSLSPGTRIADTWEVTRLIGRGGMGEVWEARHLRLPGKKLAIKVLHLGPVSLTTDALARFRREAEIATRINHPNIVAVQDFNTLPSGAPYLVLEFLEGESLASRMRFGPIPLEDVRKIVREVGSALQATHALGVVHRDLKPDNIFLVPNALGGTTAKVLDFGISKIQDSNTVQTLDAVLVGTPLYMAPEQATGNNKDVGPQSDVFAFASIIYEVLSGQQAFAAESIARIVFRVAFEPHTPLASLKPDLPAEMVRAVEHALIKSREARTANIGQFVAEFTGTPLSGIQPVPRQNSNELASGVATPGQSTPDSLMLANTAGPTPPPSAPRPLATPAKVPPAAVSRRSLIPFLGGLIAAMAAGLVLLVNRPPENPAGTDTVPTDPVVIARADVPLKDPTRVPVPTVDAGVTGIKAVLNDAGVLGVPVALPDGGRIIAVPRPVLDAMSEADEAVVRELDGDFKAGLFPDVCRNGYRRLAGLESHTARSRVNAIITMACCALKDLQEANARFKKVDERHRPPVVQACKEFGMQLSR